LFPKIAEQIIFSSHQIIQMNQLALRLPLRCSLKKILTAGIALLSLSCLVPTKVRAASFDGIYAFGDSLIDNGNFYKNSIGYDFGNQTPPFPSSPEGGYPGSPYDRGRFSNGPVFVEDLTSELGLPTSSLHDYAVGGSTSGYYHSDLRFPPSTFPGLLTQVTNYISQPADPNGLYIVSTGTNDYDISNPSFFTDPSVMSAQIATTVGNIDTAVKKLAADGVQNIMVVNVPDFGKIPAYTQILPPSALSLLTSLANAHNTALAASLPDLSSSLNAKISLLDLYSLMDGAIGNPAQYGFTNVTDGCFNLSDNSVCSNPNQYLFWDDQNHPTAAAGQDLANLALATLDAPLADPPQSVPEPKGVSGCVTFGLMISSFLLKRKLKWFDTQVRRASRR